MCKYTKDEQQTAPYPRVTYTAQCGFQLCVMEGYEMDTQTDSSGNQFQTRSTRLAEPSGKCMQCGEVITVKTENLELEGSDIVGNEVTVDLNLLKHIPEKSVYNNNWYEINEYSYLFVHCDEEFNQVDLYIANSLEVLPALVVHDSMPQH